MSVSAADGRHSARWHHRDDVTRKHQTAHLYVCIYIYIHAFHSIGRCNDPWKWLRKFKSELHLFQLGIFNFPMGSSLECFSHLDQFTISNFKVKKSIKYRVQRAKLSIICEEMQRDDAILVKKKLVPLRNSSVQYRCGILLDVQFCGRGAGLVARRVPTSRRTAARDAWTRLRPGARQIAESSRRTRQGSSSSFFPDRSFVDNFVSHSEHLSIICSLLPGRLLEIMRQFLVDVL